MDARRETLQRVVDEVADVIFAGGTVIFPTDTSYAIGCDPFATRAVDRIYAAKGRPDERPLTLHVATPAEFLEYAPGSTLAQVAAKRLLPGPVILLVRKPEFVAHDVAAALQTLALRVPDEPLARAILERCGPLAATTVNAPGVARYGGEGERSMLPGADLLVENGPTHYASESTIVDITGAQARLIREGIVKAQRLVELFGPIERPTVKVRTHV